MRKAILFDQDGTLLDSAPGIKRCANFTLEKLGYPLIPYKELDFFIGPPLKECFRLAGVKDEDLEEAIRIFRGEYESKGGFEAYVYPDVEKTLQELKSRGHRLFVCTCKIQTTSGPILSKFGLRSYFDGIYGVSRDGSVSTKSQVIKVCLRNESLGIEAIMVGDTELDVFGAKENGIPCLAADYGYGDKKKLREAGPIGHLARFSDLLNCFD